MSKLSNLWRRIGPVARTILRADANTLAVHVVGDVAHVVDQKTGLPVTELLIHSILPGAGGMSTQAMIAANPNRPAMGSGPAYLKGGQP